MNKKEARREAQRTAEDRYQAGEINFGEYIALLARSRNQFTLNRQFEKGLTPEQIDMIIEQLNGPMRTMEVRRNVIYALNSCYGSSGPVQQELILSKVEPHTAIIANMLDNYTFRGCEKRLWENGTGKRILRRSQRSLRHYLSVIDYFATFVKAEDLEFGVYMALQNMKPNIVCKLLNEFDKVLTPHQKERLESAAMALHMMGSGITKSAHGFWSFDRWAMMR